MSCPICDNKDPDTLQAIKAAYLDEGASAEDISLEFGIPYEMALNHISKCISTGDGVSVERLQSH